MGKAKCLESAGKWKRDISTYLVRGLRRPKLFKEDGTIARPQNKSVNLSTQRWKDNKRFVTTSDFLFSLFLYGISLLLMLIIFLLDENSLGGKDTYDIHIISCEGLSLSSLYVYPPPWFSAYQTF